MPWSGGSYTRPDGSAQWANDRDAGIKILASEHDTHDQDLAAGINNCLTKDGSNSASGNVNLGGNKIVNLGTPTAATDAATKGYVDTASGITFVAGNQILFRGAATPAGWSVVAQNDKALRIVSGAPGSGGAVNFSAVFNAAGGGTALTLAQMPGHVHLGNGGINNFYMQQAGSTGPTAGPGGAFATPAPSATTGDVSGGKTSGNNGDAHTHVTPNLAYYDMNLIQKS